MDLTVVLSCHQNTVQRQDHGRKDDKERKGSIFSVGVLFGGMSPPVIDRKWYDLAIRNFPLSTFPLFISLNTTCPCVCQLEGGGKLLPAVRWKIHIFVLSLDTTLLKKPMLI
jgi:hypothetical protein